jgi:hypothetical protein
MSEQSITAFGNYYIRSYDRQSSHERHRDFIGQMKITAKHLMEVSRLEET